MPETKITADRISTTVEFEFSELSLGNGTVSLPSLAFGSDQDTGIYNIAANTLGIAAGGIQTVSSSSVTTAINGSGNINLQIGGVNLFQLGTTGYTVRLGDVSALTTAQVRVNGQLGISDGSVSVPGIHFIDDTNTGMYRSSENTINFSAGGTDICRIDTSFRVITGHNLEMGTTSQFQASDGSAATPSISFQNDVNLGLYRIGTDEMGLAAGGGNLLWRFGFSGGLQTTFRGGTNPALPGLALGEASSVGFYRIAGLDQLGISAPINVTDGTAAIPSLSFANVQNSGIYTIGSGWLNFAASGGQVGRFDGATGQFEVNDGAAGTPVYSFIGDTNTGMYRIGSDHMGFSTNGTLRWQIDSSGAFAVLGGSSHQILASAGNVSAPAYSFNVAGATDTGIYQTGTGSVRFASDGVNVISSVGSGLEINLDGSAASPSINFGVDPDTGIYRAGTNQVGIAGGAVSVAIFNPDTANANQLTLNSAPGNVPAFGVSVANTTPGTNTSADSRGLAVSVNDGNSGDPYILWAIGGPTRYWTMGIDNSNSDVLAVSTTAGGTAKPGTGDIALFAPNAFQLIDGTEALPAYTFINDSNTGIYRFASDGFGLVSGGTRKMSIGGDVELNTRLSPDADNTRGLGFSGRRWTELWAANGTIQTSHSSTKEVLGEIAEDAEIPQGIYFKRPGSDRIHVGFLADNLPQEAFYEDGVSVETASPIGVLCANVRRLDRENKELKQMIQDLMAKLGE